MIKSNCKVFFEGRMNEKWVWIYRGRAACVGASEARALLMATSMSSKRANDQFIIC